MKKNTLHTLLVILAMLQIVSIVKINNLQRQIENTKLELNSIGHQMVGEVGAIYSNVDNKLEEKASLIESASTEIGRLNKEEHTVPVTFKLTPKQVSEQTLVSLDFNGELVPMRRNGINFYVTVTRDVLGETSPKIVIDENGIKTVTKDDQIGVLNMKDEIFPTMFPRLLGEARFDGSTYKRSGGLVADTKESVSEIEFTKLQLLIKVDDKVVSEKELDNQAISAATNIEIDEKIPMADGQICTMTVIATDSLGFEHHYLIDNWLAGSNAQREPWFENEKIYSEDGELIWETEFR